MRLRIDVLNYSEQRFREAAKGGDVVENLPLSFLCAIKPLLSGDILLLQLNASVTDIPVSDPLFLNSFRFTGKFGFLQKTLFIVMETDYKAFALTAAHKSFDLQGSR